MRRSRSTIRVVAVSRRCSRPAAQARSPDAGTAATSTDPRWARPCFSLASARAGPPYGYRGCGRSQVQYPVPPASGVAELARRRGPAHRISTMLIQARFNADQRGLAGAIRSEQGEDLAGADFEREMIHDRAAVVALRDALNFEHGIPTGGGVPGDRRRPAACPSDGREPQFGRILSRTAGAERQAGAGGWRRSQRSLGMRVAHRGQAEPGKRARSVAGAV